MSEEVKPSQEAAPETTPEIEAPSDYREYVKWRATGEAPAKDEPPPAAVAETPPAKTEPQSGAEEVQQPEEADEDEAVRPGRGGSRQRKIDRLTRENELLKQQLTAVNQQKPAQAPPQAEPPNPAKLGKPKLHDFATLEQYQEALTDWKLDQREAQKRAEAAQAEARTAEEKLQTEWNSRQQSARSTHSDYDEVIQSVSAPNGPGVLAARQAMLEDDAGAEILYHLATHPEELQRIAALQPVAAIREIGRLSATLTPSSAAGKDKPKVSGAPKPPPPLSRPSGQGIRNDVHDEKLATDYKAWSRVREAQLKGQ
jgi:hypothetical protein